MTFYCATIAYHVGLIAVLGRPSDLANVLEKKTFSVDRCRGCLPIGVQGPSKDQALASCIQSLLSKNVIERVENVKSLRFYSRLFLVPKPHQGGGQSQT